MYGIFTYIWLICMVNVGKCALHGWYGCVELLHTSESLFPGLLFRIGVKTRLGWSLIIMHRGYRSNMFKSPKKVFEDSMTVCESVVLLEEIWLTS